MVPSYLFFLLREHMPTFVLIFSSLMIDYTLLNKSNSLVILGSDEVILVSKNSTENFDSYLNKHPGFGISVLISCLPPPSPLLYLWCIYLWVLHSENEPQAPLKCTTLSE